MPVSQNLSFAGSAPEDPEYSQPPGLTIARMLHAAAAKHGWVPGEWDNWRDSGWSFSCARGGATLQVVLASIGEDQWMLQLAPSASPGLLGRALGRRPSATAQDCLALAKLVHEALAQEPRYTAFRWAWDGPPNQASPSEPLAP
jgi:hypothetical protein